MLARILDPINPFLQVLGVLRIPAQLLPLDDLQQNIRQI